MKNENNMFKILGIASVTIGAIAVGTTAWAMYKRTKDEAEIIESTAEAAALNEETSGANGSFRRIKSNYRVGFTRRGIPQLVLINRLKTPVGGTQKKGPWTECGSSYNLENGYCIKK